MPRFPLETSYQTARLSAVAIATFFFVSVMLVAAPLRAGSYTWAVSSGNWSIATNWGGTVPTINDSGFVVNGGTATVTTLGIAYNSLDIDGGSTLQMLSGNMQAGTFVGNGERSTWAIPAPAISVQSGGTVQIYQYFSSSLCIANQAGSVGNYTMTGNSLLSLGDDGGYGAVGGTVGCSGTGTFTQSSGIVSIYDYNGGNLSLGAASGGVGYYSLSGNGLLSVNGDALPGGETVAPPDRARSLSRAERIRRTEESTSAVVRSAPTRCLTAIYRPRRWVLGFRQLELLRKPAVRIRFRIA